MSITAGQTCPLCQTELDPVPVRNALSRYVNDYICSSCGNVEALTVALIGSRTTGDSDCLYFDLVGGIMRVVDNEPGYYPLFPHPSEDETWCRGYVDAVNHLHGHSKGEVLRIVASSMFGAQR